MYVSWKWISELVDTTGVDPIAFADRFTLAVAEIEGVTRFGHGLEAVKVARVVDVQPHPNADKLRLATCDLGDERVTVVCGAPDLRLELLVPFVPPNVTLPSGITVRHGEVRGVPSPGMLASEADLGLSDDHSGLMDLASLGVEAGQAFISALPCEDVLYEIDNKSITHRPDLWGHFGMAREVAALLQRPLLAPSTEVQWGDAAAPVVDLQDGETCRRYLCAELRDVQVAPSPLLTQLRLRSLGVRPINNVVDATNLVMLETGNPLHAFDAGQVKDGQIIVRRAHQGESITTLDGESRALLPSDCVIASQDEAVALAGVMGGQDSEIREHTSVVLLEAASFDGAHIRKTASRLGLRTESSARFEKHLDPNTARLAAHRFVRVLQELCPQARASSALADLGPFVEAPQERRVVTTSRGYLRSRLGVSAEQMSDDWILQTLTSLEFGVEAAGADQIAVTVPSFRAGRDVSIQEDLVEELGRIYGYDHIPSEAPTVHARPAALPASKRQERTARAALSLGEGLTELVLYSFESDAALGRLGLKEVGADGHTLPRLTLRNYLSSDMRCMRRCLGNNLLVALEQNLSHGTRRTEGHKGLQVGLFEIGRVYQSDGQAPDPGLPAALLDDARRESYLAGLTPALLEGVERAEGANAPLPTQPRHLAMAFGERLGGGQQGWVQPPTEVTARLYASAVGAVQRLLRQLCLPAPTVRRVDSSAEVIATSVQLGAAWIHPARHGGVWVSGQLVGLISMLHPDVRNALDVPAEVALVELDLEALLALAPVSERGDAPAKFPPSTFDLTVPCAASVRAGPCVSALKAELLGARDGVSVEVDWIRDFIEPEAEHGRAMTLRVTCRRPDGSLTDKDISAVRERAIAQLSATAGVRPGWGDEMRAAS